MKFEDLKKFQSYLYNRVDYFTFKEALKTSDPYLNDNYIEEKWPLFNQNSMLFVTNYDNKFFDYLYDKMEKENFKG